MPFDMPALVLWAWDRDDDLSFIDSRDTAVAYLAATVILRGETVFLTPRHHPLAPPKGFFELHRIPPDGQIRLHAAAVGLSSSPEVHQPPRTCG
jgi:hypothetical protein